MHWFPWRSRSRGGDGGADGYGGGVFMLHLCFVTEDIFYGDESNEVAFVGYENDARPVRQLSNHYVYCAGISKLTPYA